MLFSLVTLPVGATTDMTANVGTLFADLWPLVAVIVGIPFGFYIIRKVIALIPKGK